MLLLTLGSKPALNGVGLPSRSIPLMPLNPSMWSNDRFSIINTNTCLILGCRFRSFENREIIHFEISNRAHLIVSHATQISFKAQENMTQIAFTIHAKALQTHFATQ